MEISNLLLRAGFRVVRREIRALRLKILTCRFPFRAGYAVSKGAGCIAHVLRWKPGVSDLTVYAVREDQISAGVRSNGHGRKEHCETQQQRQIQNKSCSPAGA